MGSMSNDAQLSRLVPFISHATDCPLIRSDNGDDVGEIQQIQDKGKAVPEAKEGAQVAISMEKPIVGRHIFERDVLYAKVSESDAKVLATTCSEMMSDREHEVLQEYVKIMQKKMPFWGGF